MVEVVLIGLGLGAIFGLASVKGRKQKAKMFVCGHCESEDTLSKVKLREKDTFVCSFCSKILDEDILLFTYKEDYEMLKNHPEHYEEFKKARKEGRDFEIPSGEDHTNT
jgi:hypothetical protein